MRSCVDCAYRTTGVFQLAYCDWKVPVPSWVEEAVDAADRGRHFRPEVPYQNCPAWKARSEEGAEK